MSKKKMSRSRYRHACIQYIKSFDLRGGAGYGEYANDLWQIDFMCREKKSVIRRANRHLRKLWKEQNRKEEANMKLKIVTMIIALISISLCTMFYLCKLELLGNIFALIGTTATLGAVISQINK